MSRRHSLREQKAFILSDQPQLCAYLLEFDEIAGDVSDKSLSEKKFYCMEGSLIECFRKGF